jgi:NAD(P)-dependent dehydrogenase (short-subunit alcohol dehydrogenase family)
LQDSIEALKTKFPSVDYRAVTIDFGSQASVRAGASQILAWDDVPTVDLMINNAAVGNLPTRTLSPEGIEMHLATNHIGHFLLTNLLAPKLIAASKVNPHGTTRVINISSASPWRSAMRWSDTSFEKPTRELPPAEQPDAEVHKNWGLPDISDMSYIPLEGYNQSKVANVLFGISLTARTFAKHGILSLTAHPGIIKTELVREFPEWQLEATRKMNEMGVFAYRTRGAGAATGLVAALDPKLGPGRNDVVPGKENLGAYLADCQVSDMARDLAVSSSEAEKLWKMSEDMVGQKFEW